MILVGTHNRQLLWRCGACSRTYCSAATSQVIYSILAAPHDGRCCWWLLLR